MCSPSSAITPLWKAMIFSWTRFSSTRIEPMRASRGSTLPNRLPTSTDMHDRRNPILLLPEGEGRDEGEGDTPPPMIHLLAPSPSRARSVLDCCSPLQLSHI